MFVTWTYINTHKLHQDVGGIAVENCSTLNIDIRHLQICFFNVRQDRSRRGHHYGETWLTSSLSSSRGPKTDISRPGIKPRTPRWEANTLAKSYLNSLLKAIWNIYMTPRYILSCRFNYRWVTIAPRDSLRCTYKYLFYANIPTAGPPPKGQRVTAAKYWQNPRGAVLYTLVFAKLNTTVVLTKPHCGPPKKFRRQTSRGLFNKEIVFNLDF